MYEITKTFHTDGFYINLEQVIWIKHSDRAWARKRETAWNKLEQLQTQQKTAQPKGQADWLAGSQAAAAAVTSYTKNMCIVMRLTWFQRKVVWLFVTLQVNTPTTSKWDRYTSKEKAVHAKDEEDGSENRSRKKWRRRRRRRRSGEMRWNKWIVIK